MRKIVIVIPALVVLVLLTLIPVLAQPPMAATACPGAPAPRLTVGGSGRVAQVFSSLRAAFDSNVILTVLYRANNDTFTVVSGPNCGTGPYNWWQVQYKGITGWVTEGTGSTYWLEPVTVGPTPTPPPITVTPAPAACPGAPAPRLKIGGNGQVAQVFSSLRAGLDSNVILTVLYRANNDTFKVLAGPYCGTYPINWWQVQYKGTTGWVTEGYGSAYWVEPAP